jgi:hypothetical protein
MKIITLLTAAFLFALTSPTTHAKSKEIDHLFSFIESTKCMYERNGKTYNGKEALKHIKKKYGYFREHITSTEDFIAYSASKSKMSGKSYKVNCPDHPKITSAEWLHAELQLFREEQTGLNRGSEK